MVYSKLRFCSLELSRFGGNILDSRLVESTGFALVHRVGTPDTPPPELFKVQL